MSDIQIGEKAVKRPAKTARRPPQCRLGRAGPAFVELPLTDPPTTQFVIALVEAMIEPKQ
jgi:hypothetical protein